MTLSFFNNKGSARFIETEMRKVDIVHASTGEILIQAFPLDCVFYKEDENDFDYNCIGITEKASQELDEALGFFEDEYFFDDFNISYNQSKTNRLYVKNTWEL